MRHDFMPTRHTGPRQLRGSFDGLGDGKYGDRSGVLIQNIEHSPDAARTAVLEGGLHHRFTTRLRRHTDIVKRALGLGVAVRQRTLGAALDIEVEVDGNVRATRPLWIWQALAVAEKIPLDHRVWFDLQHDV